MAVHKPVLSVVSNPRCTVQTRLLWRPVGIIAEQTKAIDGWITDRIAIELITTEFSWRIRRLRFVFVFLLCVAASLSPSETRARPNLEGFIDSTFPPRDFHGCRCGALSFCALNVPPHSSCTFRVFRAPRSQPLSRKSHRLTSPRHPKLHSSAISWLKLLRGLHFWSCLTRRMHGL